MHGEELQAWPFRAKKLTTFSSYAVNVEDKFHSGDTGVAVIHLVLTPVLAMIAVFVGTAIARRVM
ncbi:hypothetical protein ACFV0L_00090 [Streptosporangium canum]|uniref:hypothetical protein n=1 Tax=Streptosporangium canum TaxID=324952 RepID=UPI0036A1B6DE